MMAEAEQGEGLDSGESARGSCSPEAPRPPLAHSQPTCTATDMSPTLLFLTIIQIFILDSRAQVGYNDQKFGGKYTEADFLDDIQRDSKTTGSEEHVQHVLPVKEHIYQDGVKGHKIVEKWQPYPILKHSEGSSKNQNVSENQESKQTESIEKKGDDTSFTHHDDIHSVEVTSTSSTPAYIPRGEGFPTQMRSEEEKKHETNVSDSKENTKTDQTILDHNSTEHQTSTAPPVTHLPNDNKNLESTTHKTAIGSEVDSHKSNEDDASAQAQKDHISQHIQVVPEASKDDPSHHIQVITTSTGKTEKDHTPTSSESVHKNSDEISKIFHEDKKVILESEHTVMKNNESSEASFHPESSSISNFTNKEGIITEMSLKHNDQNNNTSEHSTASTTTSHHFHEETTLLQQQNSTTLPPSHLSHHDHDHDFNYTTVKDTDDDQQKITLPPKENYDSLPMHEIFHSGATSTEILHSSSIPTSSEIFIHSGYEVHEPSNERSETSTHKARSVEYDISGDQIPHDSFMAEVVSKEKIPSTESYKKSGENTSTNDNSNLNCSNNNCANNETETQETSVGIGKVLINSLLGALSNSEESTLHPIVEPEIQSTFVVKPCEDTTKATCKDCSDSQMDMSAQSTENIKVHEYILAHKSHEPHAEIKPSETSDSQQTEEIKKDAFLLIEKIPSLHSGEGQHTETINVKHDTETIESEEHGGESFPYKIDPLDVVFLSKEQQDEQHKEADILQDIQKKYLDEVQEKEELQRKVNIFHIAKETVKHTDNYTLDKNESSEENVSLNKNQTSEEVHTNHTEESEPIVSIVTEISVEWSKNHTSEGKKGKDRNILSQASRALNQYFVKPFQFMTRVLTQR